MADSESVYPKPVKREPLTGLKRSPADLARKRAAYGPVKEMVVTYDNGEKSTPYYEFDSSELSSRTPVKEALRRPKNNATIPTPRRNLKYPDSYDLKRGYTGQKGTEKNDAAERLAKTLEKMAKGGKVGKVMGEFKSGSLKSSSGQKVTNRKQAMAIAMSEAGKSMKTKKYAAGGKTDKRSFSSGDVFSNYDVGADPFLKSRKGGTFTDKEMKDGLTKGEIMRKTEPKEPPKAKKYAAGGQTSAPRPTNPFTNPSQYAAEKTAMKPPKRPPDYDMKVRDFPDYKKYKNPPPPKPDMGVLPGYGGPAPRPVAPRPVQPITYKYVNGKAVPVGMKRGGKVGESEKMVNNELKFMRSKGAPKSMIEHEKKEAKGVKKMAKGGMSCMKKGGNVQKFAKGGSIDGCAVRGKTKLPRGGK